MEKIIAHLIGDQITSNSKEAQNLYSIQRFGEKTKDKVTYMLVEALFLLEDEKMEIFDIKDRKIKLKKLLKKLLKLDKKIILKYIAYKNLREKGLIPKTALKYGADFRIYKKKGTHSNWICFVASEKETLTWQEFSSKNRVAHSTKKNLLIAIVDEENDLTYYEVSWKKL
jgi:tRNA-intron endonuclease, archaea type